MSSGREASLIIHWAGIIDGDDGGGGGGNTIIAFSVFC